MSHDECFIANKVGYCLDIPSAFSDLGYEPGWMCKNSKKSFAIL